MPDIKLRRSHKLGLPKARKIAWKWAEKVEEKFGLECTVIEGDDGDTVAFERSGVRGELQVAADHFDLHARLGFLLGAFSKSIEAEIEKELDALLGQAAARKAPAKTPSAKAKRKAT
jgi:putative polyhydroxyalkanoate system protein